MVVKEFGENNNEIIMLLHGGGLSWWNYKDEAEELKSRFHVIIPILNGHSDSDKDFTTIEDNAQEIIDYINNNCNGHIKLIGGLSLGGQILLEILSRKSDICEYAIVESTLVIPMKLSYKLIEPSINVSYWLVFKKWFSKLQFNYLKIKQDLFYDYYMDTCKIIKKNMIAFLKANLKYEIKDSLKDTKAKVLVVWGNKEKSNIKKSGQIIHDKIGNSKIKIIKDYYHGDLSINNSKYYIDLLNELIINSK